MLLIKRPWTKKPSYPRKVDWSNPLSKGLKHAWMFNDSDNVIRDIVGTAHAEPIGTPLKGTDRNGLLADYANGGTTAHETGAVTDIAGISESTIIIFASDTSYDANPAALSLRYDEWTDQLLIIYPFDYADGDGVRCYWSGTVIINQNGASLADGDMHQFALVNRSATDHEMYVDTASVGTASDNLSLPTPITNIDFGKWYGTNQLFTGKLGYALIYDRALSEKERKALYDNPYQILEPNVLYLPVSSAAGGTTHDGAFTLAKTHAITNAVTATRLGSVTLAKSNTIAKSVIANLLASTTLARTHTVTPDALIDLLASTSLARNNGLVLDSEITIEAALSLALNKGFANDAQWDLLANVTFTKNLAAGFTPTADMAAATTLGRTHVITQDGGQDITAALSLAITDGITTDTEIGIAGVVSLGKALGQTQDTLNIYETALSLGREAIFSTVNDAIIGAGLTLSAIRSIAIDGTAISIGVVTPDHRILYIEAEVRILAVEAEDRVYAIGEENRIYPIEN